MIIGEAMVVAEAVNLRAKFQKRVQLLDAGMEAYLASSSQESPKKVSDDIGRIQQIFEGTNVDGVTKWDLLKLFRRDDLMKLASFPINESYTENNGNVATAAHTRVGVRGSGLNFTPKESQYGESVDYRYNGDHAGLLDVLEIQSGEKAYKAEFHPYTEQLRVSDGKRELIFKHGKVFGVTFSTGVQLGGSVLDVREQEAVWNLGRNSAARREARMAKRVAVH